MKSMRFTIAPSKRNFVNSFTGSRFLSDMSSTRMYTAGMARAMSVASAAPSTPMSRPHMKAAFRPIFTTQLIPALVMVTRLLR